LHSRAGAISQTSSPALTPPLRRRPRPDGSSAAVGGGGLEYAVDRNWTARIEYNYLDFGTDRVRFDYFATGTSPGLLEHWDARNTAHVVKFGVNYLFGAR
jgi:hypothetical protein